MNWESILQALTIELMAIFGLDVAAYIIKAIKNLNLLLLNLFFYYWLN